MSTDMRADAQQHTESSWAERAAWAASELIAVELRNQVLRLPDDSGVDDEEFL